MTPEVRDEQANSMRAEIRAIARFCQAETIGIAETDSVVHHCSLFLKLAYRYEREIRREHRAAGHSPLKFNGSNLTRSGETADMAKMRAEWWAFFMSAEGLRGELKRQKQALGAPPAFLQARARGLLALIPESEWSIEDVVIIRIFCRTILGVAKKLRGALKLVARHESREIARHMIQARAEHRPKKRSGSPTPID